MPPTVSGVVSDASGNTAAWSASWTVGTTPPTGNTVFGCSDGVWPLNGVAKVNGIRIYLGGGDLTASTSWTATAELKNGLARVLDGGTVWLSIKDNRFTDLDRVVKQFFTVTAGRNLKLLVTYRHEPENDVDDPSPPWTTAKQADINAYQTAWANLLPAIQGNGAKAATCLLGDRVSPNSPNNAESIAYHVPGVDYVGFDRYNPGLGNATNYVTPHTVLGGCVQYAINRSAEASLAQRRLPRLRIKARRLANKVGLFQGLGAGQLYPLVIGEWGTIAVGSDGTGAGGDQAGRRTWAAGYVAEIKAIHADPARPTVPVCLYWNQSRMAFNTDPTNQLAQVALDL